MIIIDVKLNLIFCHRSIALSMRFNLLQFASIVNLLENVPLEDTKRTMEVDFVAFIEALSSDYLLKLLGLS